MNGENVEAGLSAGAAWSRYASSSHTCIFVPDTLARIKIFIPSDEQRTASICFQLAASPIVHISAGPERVLGQI